MKAKVDMKFAIEEKRMVDAALGLILFTFGVVLIVMGLVSIVSTAILSGYFYKTITTPPSQYIHPLFEVIFGIIVLSFGMWALRTRI
ncbi:MAG: hypothetical protein BJBARM5_0667 [Candidatus Parvarchaeum acidophilus ARMAN-5]|jgi:hypothetical protein|uniref:Uncharacterized protein n=1 Tax=Candidatus Parvarchaeum acidophilus ARMAN-5 TaxID=662762 RepID=D6GVZ6_PARA5|nr:MAG: hypothetical protein BJBARM5_0667 [Candidatus Parvarchaeum acidophilus ARMAN-5]